ncbi:Uncharacterised protein [Staphylococcus agnetis]|nr:Uncharacterised protein [Staphylococcus agnetis]
MNLIDQVKQTLVDEIKKVFSKPVLQMTYQRLKLKYQKTRKMVIILQISPWF